MSARLNPLHVRVGEGAGYFPILARGGTLGAFACPCADASLPHEAGGIVLYFDIGVWRATLTPAEARSLAAELLRLADELA